MANKTFNEGTGNAEVQKLEIEFRIAELTAQKSEARLRALEAEEKVREILARRAKALGNAKSGS